MINLPVITLNHKKCIPFFLLLAGLLPLYLNASEQGVVVNTYQIENPLIKESSGLACSNRNVGYLWTHNDSGHMPIVYLMDNRGKGRNAFFLEDAENRDWEDMTAYTDGEKHYLLIADTGDNLGMFYDYSLYIIEEPVVDPAGRLSETATVRRITFRYADNQSYDVEAVAVDSIENRVILIAKHTREPMIFALPLQPGKQDLIAAKVGKLGQGIKPTAMDISADSKLIAVLSYGRVYLYHRADFFTGKNPKPYSFINFKGLFQPEAICIAGDNKRLYVSSEKKAKLLEIRLVTE